MTPERLVPTLETCQRLEKAGFGNSTYFSWVFINTPHSDWGAMEQWHVHRPSQYDYENHDVVPAPTLQEALEALPRFYHEHCKGLSLEWIELKNKETGVWSYQWWIGYDDIDTLLHNSIAASHPSNAAEAAALLWLELNKEASNETVL